jgi:hypothetical protein
MSNQTAVVTGATGQVLVNSTTWVELKAGSARLDGRKWLLVQNKSNVHVLFTTDQTLTLKSCPEIGVSQFIQLPVSDSVAIYMKSKSGANKRVAVMELA